MKYKIKYRTKGKVETYIALATSQISMMSDEIFEAHELVNVLQGVANDVMECADRVTKGRTASPKFEIDEGADKSLSVYNTLGREVLSVWFERIY